MKCEICGKEFEPLKADHRYCSKKCRARAQYLKNHPPEKRVCEICGREYETTAPKSKYCSQECGYEANKRSKRKRRPDYTFTNLPPRSGTRPMSSAMEHFLYRFAYCMKRVGANEI